MTPESISTAERPAVGLGPEDQPQEQRARRRAAAMLSRLGTVHTRVSRVGVVRHRRLHLRSTPGSRIRRAHPSRPHACGADADRVARRRRGSSRWARVADLADQLLDHVLEGGQPEDRRRRRRRRGPCGRRGAAGSRARRAAGRRRATGANGRIHLSSIDALAARLVGLEHVLDVQVADQLAVVADDREPAVAGRGAQRLDVGAGRAAAHGRRASRAASAPSATVFSVKPSAPASRSYSSASSRPSPRDSSTSAATSSRV